MRFASYARSGPGPRERFCGTWPRAQGPAGAVNAVPRGLRGRCPARSPLSVVAVCVVSARRSPPFFSGLPRPCLLDLGCPAQSPWGTLSDCVTQMGTPKSGLARRGQPSRPLSLRSRRPGAAPGAEAQPRALVPALGFPVPLPAAALCPSPVPSSLAPAPSRGGWPAEGPVGPEICHRQGGERPLGEEPCRCILFSKKIKYFHGKLSLCVFLSPPFSFCSFLLGRLPGSAPCLLPLETPPGCPLLAPAVGPALPGAWAVQRLARLCTPSVQASPRPRGQREGQRVAVWPQVHGESRQPVSQLCLPALPAQPRVCSPGPRHTLACLLCGSACCQPTEGR